MNCNCLSERESIRQNCVQLSRSINAEAIRMFKSRSMITNNGAILILLLSGMYLVIIVH
ncbi:Uncharacterized protein BM_BM18022 [Brugia malayi]|uniref:Uncharacterized protein n=1 Tax=Brugia malayi TaxID=6279 RepID=A0A4E9EXA2_BRUMA|nr:Uncharacterized protein BM_BM18022 [Brugia malayi]VIO88569.1 Uncharacterized protein BM_BM18022 [Brugia malayi]